MSNESSLINVHQTLEEYRQLTSPTIKQRHSQHSQQSQQPQQSRRNEFNFQTENQINESNQHVNSELKYNEMMNTIETMEQTIIQHIRTTGIKKTREVSLIDEILNMKKSRRQIFSQLIREITNSNEYSTNLEQLLQYEKNHSKQKMEQGMTEMRAELDSKKKQLDKLESKYKSKMESLHVKYHEQIQNEKLIIQTKYENRLKELEEIVAKVQQQANQNKQQNVIEESKHQQMLELALQKQENHYLGLIKRYKDGLKKLLEKEKTLEDSLTTLQSSYNNLKKDNSALEIQCNELKEDLLTEQNLHLKTKQHNNELESKLSQVIDKYRKLKADNQSDNESIRTMTSQTIQELKMKHEDELRSIDEKIRVALHSKDELIELLKRELKEAVERCRHSEEVLEKLNDEIVAR